jgi:hypothetical protein
MVDRLINWGADATDARYQTRDSSPTGGDFVVANDTTGGGQLLIWDYTAGEWVYGGPVNMGGNDITNAGSVAATSLKATEGTVNGKEIPGYGKSTAGDLSLGDWETVSSDRPARLSLTGSISTDGTDNARMVVEIDESGGTTGDYSVVLVEANSTQGSGTFQQDSREVTLPPGASYRVYAESDPENTADFTLERVFEL